MNLPYFLLTLLAVVAQLALPRRWAFLPLIFAACHMGASEILPQLTLARLLIILGIGRAMSGGYFVSPKGTPLDKIFYAFAFFIVLSRLGHSPDEYYENPLISRIGLVLNIFGTYLYGRTYLPDIDCFKRYAFVLPIILIPGAIIMAVQKKTGNNYYSILGPSFREDSLVRDDKIRANGAFKHPILAGCSGATALPLVFIAWYRRRKLAAIVGTGTCLVIVVSSASSGPLAAVAVAIFAVFFWRWREYLRHFFWGLAGFGVFYVLWSGKGPWYLMASIDLVGGSTGWHRAKLMDQGYHYLNEWWLFGSDYTRHWMSSGVRWNPNVVDFTNYYLHLGVTGGLAVMLCLIAMIVVSARLLTTRMKELRTVNNPDEIVLWFAAASLASHAMSFVSISYFDQMYIVFYLLIGAIPGLVNRQTPSEESATDWDGQIAADDQEYGHQLR